MLSMSAQVSAQIKFAKFSKILKMKIALGKFTLNET